MFPQFNPQMNMQGQPPTTSMLSQNTQLLGMPQMQTAQNVTNLNNSTAPSSSTTDPQVANMVKALKGNR